MLGRIGAGKVRRIQTRVLDAGAPEGAGLRAGQGADLGCGGLAADGLMASGGRLARDGRMARDGRLYSRAEYESWYPKHLAVIRWREALGRKSTWQ